MTRALALAFATILQVQTHGQATTSEPPALIWTAEQDHQNMMDQLGIRKLRPAPSGDEKAPNAANYDESKANPWPELPDPLTLKNGSKVTSAADWWQKRRPEIVEDLEREVYGRIPRHTPQVTWRVVLTDKEFVGRTPVVARRLVGHVDNSAYPAIAVDLEATEVVPLNVKGPVPMLVMFGQALYPLPRNRQDQSWRESIRLSATSSCSKTHL